MAKMMRSVALSAILLAAGTLAMSFATPSVGAASPGATGPSDPGHVCSPLDHGAVGDGTTLDTVALQQTIDACVGGVVQIPAGTYLTGTLNPPSDTTIHLAPGAILQGTTNKSDWNKAGLIVVANAENVTIEGGVIDGNGPHWWDEFKAGRWRPSHLVMVSDSQNVTISKILLRQSPAWTLDILRSSQVLADRVTIRNPVVVYPEAANTDGIDIVSSHDVEVGNCDIETSDDGIALKTNKDMGPDTNIDVHDCTLAGWAHGFTIGLETWEDFKHITFRNSVIRASRYSNPGMTYFGAIALVSMYGANIDDVAIDNITVEDVKSPIFLRVQGGGGYPANEDVTPGSLGNVSFQNFKVLHSTQGSAILGDPTRPLGPLAFDNVSIVSAEGGTAADANLPINDSGLHAYPSPRILGVLPAYGLFFRDVAGPVSVDNVRISSVAAQEGRPKAIVECPSGVRLSNSDTPIVLPDCNAPAPTTSLPTTQTSPVAQAVRATPAYTG